MNKEQLESRLKKQNINPNLYALDGNPIVDRIILMKVDLGWEIFYFDDKGKKENVKRFLNENDACDYVYQVLKDDQQTANQFGLNQ